MAWVFRVCHWGSLGFCSLGYMRATPPTHIAGLSSLPGCYLRYLPYWSGTDHISAMQLRSNTLPIAGGLHNMCLPMLQRRCRAELLKGCHSPWPCRTTACSFCWEGRLAGWSWAIYSWLWWNIKKILPSFPQPGSLSWCVRFHLLGGP